MTGMGLSAKIRSTKSEIRNNIEFQKYQFSKQDRHIVLLSPLMFWWFVF